MQLGQGRCATDVLLPEVHHRPRAVADDPYIQASLRRWQAEMLDCLRITMRLPERLFRDDSGELMIRNKELLQRTIDYIEAHPEEWDQTEWRCGTSMCFAGHAAILAGCEWRDETGSFVLLPDMEDRQYHDGNQAHVDDAARFMLGLT